MTMAITADLRTFAFNCTAIVQLLRQLTTWHCSRLLLSAVPPLQICRRDVQQSIEIACLRGPQQQTRRKLLQRSTGWTDRRTDGRTPYRYIDRAAGMQCGQS